MNEHQTDTHPPQDPALDPLDSVTEWWKNLAHSRAVEIDKLRDLLNSFRQEHDEACRSIMHLRGIVERLGHVREDEPFFILKGRDKLAADVVQEWINAAVRSGVSIEKVCGADAICQAMRNYPRKKLPD